MFLGLLAVPEPQAQALVPILNNGPDAEYLALVKKIGASHLTKGALANEESFRFETFLAGLGVEIYSQDEVKEYLNQEYRGKPWGFRALRDKDNPKGYEGALTLGSYIARDGTIDNGPVKWKSRNNGCLLGGRDTRIYSKPVPLSALRLVDQISVVYPTTTFWVSDEAKILKHVVKDPFLMVLFNSKEYIIAHWDEPRFRP